MRRASARRRRPLHIAPRSKIVRLARARLGAIGMDGPLALLASIALAVAALSCGASEGPLLVRVAGDAGSVADGSPGATVRAGMSLQYQITGELDSEVDAALYVVDLFDTAPAEVAALHARGRLVMAYVSVGSLESFRDDAARFPRTAVGKPLARYPNEAWLDHRDAEVRVLLEARFARAGAKGFDGVLLSTLGGYRADTGFALTRADQVAFDSFLVEAARGHDLSVGFSGDFELATELSEPFDWAIGVGCVARDGCSELTRLAERGVPVFVLELESDRAIVCMDDVGLPITLKRPSYDAYRDVCR